MRVWHALTLLLVAGLAALLAAAPQPLVNLQERLFDRILPDPTAAPIWVVDIGAIDDAGAEWTRAATARLVARLSEAHPRVMAFDILFAGACDEPATRDLARALEGQTVVLGLLLSDVPGPRLPAPWLGTAGAAPLWPARGAEIPCPQFAAHDIAAMALMGDADAKVRRVPVGVAVDRQAVPGLAVAMAGRALGRMPLVGPGWLRLGDMASVPAASGMIRVFPSGPSDWAVRTVSAAAVLAGKVRLPEGALILVGSSLPSRGGLRPTATSPVTPSVQIQADAVTALLSGQVPDRPRSAPYVEGGALAVTALLTLLLVIRLDPLRAALLTVGGAVFWSGAAVALTRQGVLIDPVFPALGLALVLLCALIGRAAALARAERVLRDRMGQLLPPALVSRLARQPRLMRLEGETREVTALFTDIEGFSAATAQMGAQEMVSRLDAYFGLTCGIVLRHGGMIDKLVGDSIHALFNAPLDQPGHPGKAVACAAELLAATEAFSRAHGGFGRTRIGLEYGAAVLGDVGFGTRIDYTAHGPAVNLAARLQEANKQLGTQVCIGPALAARVPDLIPLGEVEIRSFGRLALFTLRA